MRKVVNLYVENGGLSCRTGWIAGRNCQGSALLKGGEILMPKQLARRIQVIGLCVLDA